MTETKQPLVHNPYRKKAAITHRSNLSGKSQELLKVKKGEGTEGPESDDASALRSAVTERQTELNKPTKISPPSTKKRKNGSDITTSAGLSSKDKVESGCDPRKRGSQQHRASLSVKNKLKLEIAALKRQKKQQEQQAEMQKKEKARLERKAEAVRQAEEERQKRELEKKRKREEREKEQQEKLRERQHRREEKQRDSVRLVLDKLVERVERRHSQPDRGAELVQPTQTQASLPSLCHSRFSALSSTPTLHSSQYPFLNLFPAPWTIPHQHCTQPNTFFPNPQWSAPMVPFTSQKFLPCPIPGPMFHQGFGALVPQQGLAAALLEQQHSLGLSTPTMSPSLPPTDRVIPEERKKQSLPSESEEETKPENSHDVAFKIPKGAEVMANVLQPPCPLANEYELLPSAVVLTRNSAECETSFGISIKTDISSALVSPPPSPESNQPATTPGEQSTQSNEDKAPRRKRRRRMFFAALTIANAEVQNKRLSASGTISSLQPGDVVIKIADHATAGLAFSQCCALFKEQEPNPDGIVRVKVEVARRKKALPEPSPTNARVLVESSKVESEAVVAPPRTAEECCTHVSQWILDSLLECGERASSNNRNRLLGHGESLDELFLPQLELAGTKKQMLAAWTHRCQARNKEAKMRADRYWKHQWGQEIPAIQNDHPSFLTDAQRAFLRTCPRPEHGCRCKSQSHEYVNHPHCPLYSNLRAIAADHHIDFTTPSTLASKERKTRALEIEHSLTSREAAMVERQRRRRVQLKAEKREALFVSQMQKLQLSILKQAVRAPPSLKTMVVSAVLDLQDEGRNNISKQAVKDKHSVPTAPTADEDDDDDDVPLAELVDSKEELPLHRRKKRRSIPMRLSPYYVAKLAQHIALRWGHVAREPDALDHAWRWKVFHDDGFDNSIKNDTCKSPRSEGSLVWELVRWLLDDGVLATLRSADEHCSETISNEQHAESLQALAQVLDPRRGTGLMDEIDALLSCGVLEADSSHSGSDRCRLRLATHWYLYVDILMLEEMNATWGSDTAEYMVNEKLVKTLQQEWIKKYTDRPFYSRKWASCREPDRPIYDVEEFECWREGFEESHEVECNVSHGVGQFGV